MFGVGPHPVVGIRGQICLSALQCGFQSADEFGGGAAAAAEIIRACRDAGVTHVFVEQDNCYGEDPFLCLEKSYKYLCSLM